MQFSPEKSLFELPIVRWTAGCAFGISLFCTLIIACNSQLVLAFDYDGFNQAIVIFRVPLGILALGLTLIGICGANHRSEQTKRQLERTNTQIKVTESQNRFSNHYKHLEEFTKYAQLCYGNVESDSSRALYQMIFPASVKGDFTVSNSYIDEYCQNAQRMVEVLEKLDAPERSDFHDAIIQATLLRESFMEKNHLRDKDLSGQRIEYADGQVLIPGGNPQSLIDHIVRTFKFIDMLLKFDLEYRTPKLCESLISMKTGNMSTIPIASPTWMPVSVRPLIKEASKD